MLLDFSLFPFRFSLPTAPTFFYLFTFKSFFPSNGASLFYLFTFKSFFPSNGVSLFYPFTFLPFYL